MPNVEEKMSVIRDTKVVTGCDAMRCRLSSGPVEVPQLIGDVERLTALLVAHGYMAQVSFRSEVASNTDFSEFLLSQVRFIKCRFDGCNFSSADLRGATFVDCEFQECVFNDADLAGAFIHACMFTGGTVEGVRWTGAEVTRTSVSNVRGWPEMPDGFRNVVDAPCKVDPLEIPQ